MFNIFLTKYDGSFLGPIAKILGKIMEWLFSFFDLLGIANVGLCIIGFTIVIKLILLPFTVKQQRFTKLSAMMNPELQAIQAKYKDKKDQDSVMKMREETSAIYEKYGTSPTGSCVQLIIQMPILFALYRVIQNIPAYVPPIKSLYVNIVEGVGIDNLTNYLDDKAINGSDKIIDKLATFGPEQWDKLKNMFSGQSDVIAQNLTQIDKLNSFLGINLSQSPATLMGIALIIPVLSAATQWYSTKIATQVQSNMNADNPMASSMKVMNLVTPLIFGFMCYSMSAGVGLYWVMSSVVQIIQQVAINAYFSKIDVNDIIKANIEKKNKKRAKKGLPPQKVTSVANVNTKNIPVQAVSNKPAENTQSKDEQIKKSTDYYKKGNVKPGSLASKANMVSMYNDKNNKKK